MDNMVSKIIKNTKAIYPDQELADHQLVIFGAGAGGKILKKFLESRNIRINLFCDNDQNKWGKYIDGIEVLKPGDLLKMNQENLLVCIASNWAADIARQLTGLGISYLDLTNWKERWKDNFDPGLINDSLESIEEAYLLLEDEDSKSTIFSILKYRLNLDPKVLYLANYEQYFHPLVKPQPGEVIFDGGAYNGSTAVKIIKQLDGDCKIYAFEPELNNWNALQEQIQKLALNQVKPVKAGLWDDNVQGFINIDSDTALGHHVDKKGTQQIQLISIDSFVEQEKIWPDLVKMDIEGSEKNALKGAIGTIKKCKPKLIICLYHQPGDLWEIPLFLASLGCKYRYFLGHHSQNITETVLYCTV